MAAPLRRSTRIDGSAGGEPLSCGNQSTYNRVANAGNLHRLSPFQMPFGILHNLTGKSSLTFSIEKCHFITAIHADSVFIRVQMHPIRFQIGDVVALLQENDVAGHFRSGVPLEGVIRQADGPDQVGALGQVFADGGVFLIQSSLAGYERHNTARPHLVQRFAKEIVVDQPVVLVVPLIQHLEIPKGDVV